MSVRAMAHVWATSRARGTELLVALAIADFADDDGRAWPSIATLSRKARCAERTVQDSVAALRRRGELLVEVGAGPHGTNLFWVVLGGVQNPHPPQNAAGGGANFNAQGVRLGAPNPPLNRQKTTTPRARASEAAAGAVGEVVVEQDDLVEAAVWAARAAGRPPRSPAAFRRAVLRRIEVEGANAEDLDALARWRAAGDAEAQRQARLAESAAKVQAAAKCGAR